MTDQTKVREALPTNVRPTRYHLWLKPDLEAASFEGSVLVTLDVQEDTNTIVLNAAEMEITGVRLIMHQDQEATWSLDSKSEQLTLSFPRVVRKGEQASLEITFKGTLNDRMIGFYRSSYQRPDGTTSYLATTQFQPHHARRAFPCWDEPGIKATFEVTIVAPEHLAVVSNTRIAGEWRNGEGLKIVVFEKTPLVSTYLVAFVIGELEKISDYTDDGVELNFWARPGKAEQCRFALEVTKKVLKFYDEYFGRSYGSVMGVLNQLAIPDFSFGAMENWGCITYREICLLVSDASSLATRQQAAITIAHEIAHQWFGNLVTMREWDYLWLNESFATWMATKVLDHLYPEWQLWSQFVQDDMTSAMELDGQGTTHPIEVFIPCAARIDEIFDRISYEKGGSVLRMLELWLGEDGFREGLRLYMKRHAFQNTASADLWNALAETNPGRPVADVMEKWTSLAGFPVMSCSYHEQDGDGLLAISQERFRLTPNSAGDSSPWPIPLSVVTDDGCATSLLDRAMTARVLPQGALDPGHHVLVNQGRSAFCRVAYDERLWSSLVDAVRAGRLASTEERYALIDDAAALSHTGQMPASALFELASAYVNETEYPVWQGLLASLGEMIGLLEWDPKLEGTADAFVRQLLGKVVDRLGWEPLPGENSSDALLRARVLSSAIGYGDPQAIQEALRRFHFGGPIDPNLLGTVYSAVAKHGGPEGYEALLARYRAADDAETKVRLLSALGRAPDPELKRRTLEYALSSEVRPQDAFGPIASVASDPVGARLAWQFIKERWAEICERHQGNNARIGRYFQVAAALATREDLADARDFLAAHPIEGLELTAAQALERLEINCRWRETHAQAVADWLTTWGA
jgi:aminopeptidase N